MESLFDPNCFDTHKFIDEIKKRPGLYDKSVDVYNEKDLKRELWVEVAKEMVQNWDTLPEREQDDKIMSMLRKWKSLRDCFRREVRSGIDTHTKPGKWHRPRRRYLYYNSMLFLLPTMKQYEQSVPPEDTDDDKTEDGADADEEPPSPKRKHSSRNKRLSSSCSSTSRPQRQERTEMKCSTNVIGEIEVAPVQESKKEEFDEDKLFLLSLMPSFKKLTPSQKLTGKMQFLQVLQNLLEGDE